MKAIVLLMMFAVSAFAGDLKVVTTQRPIYLGGGSTSVVKDAGGKTVATATSVARPVYLGGGTITKVKDLSGKSVVIRK